MLHQLRLIWLWFFDRYILYPIMKYAAPKLGVTFMNLGYWPKPDKDKRINDFVQSISDINDFEIDKAHIYLYEKALSLNKYYPTFDDLNILEISCGQAHSIDWIRRWHGSPQNVIGCDKIISKKRDDLIFADAVDLPFFNDSFDFILNIEASHLYSNCQKFFNECNRVLCTGGTLSWLDLRYPYEIEIVKKQAENAGFKLLHWEDITENVVLGLNKTSIKYDYLLKKSPFFIKMFSSSLRNTYCAPGTHNYQRLVDRKRIYLAASWIKE